MPNAQRSASLLVGGATLSGTVGAPLDEGPYAACAAAQTDPARTKPLQALVELAGRQAADKA